MNPDLSDPHNHVPEVSPDDEWGDAGGTTVLPRKRIVSPGAGGQAATRAGEGLRIESNLQRIRTDDPEERLEVLEIDGSVIRLSPTEISPPRVAKQSAPFQERPARGETGGFRRGELHEWGRAGRYSVKWLLGTGLGVASLVVLAMLLLPVINKSNAARPDQSAGLVIDPVEKTKDLDVLNAMFVRQPEAEQVFHAYATAQIADDVLPLVRDAKAVEPLIRANHQPLEVPYDWSPPSETSWSIAGENGRIYGLLDVTLPDFSKFSAYMIPENGSLLLDWKASTGFGTAGFEELATGTGNAAEVRVLIEPTGFYNAVFPEQDYRSYQLLSPDRERSIWGYTRKGEPADATVGTLFQNGVILKGSDDPLKVTLSLARGPAESLPNQWLIVEMLHKDWIKP